MVKVHLVERDHQVVNAAVSKVVERLLLDNTTPGEGAIVRYRVVCGEVEEHGREDGETRAYGVLDLLADAGREGRVEVKQPSRCATPAREAISETDPPSSSRSPQSHDGDTMVGVDGGESAPGLVPCRGRGEGAPHQVDRPCARNRRGVSEAVSRGWGCKWCPLGDGWGQARVAGWAKAGTTTTILSGRAEEGPEQGWITRG